METGGPFEEGLSGAHGGVQFGVAAGDALDIQEIVDEADEAVGVADGDVEHLRLFFGLFGEGPAGDEAERGAERGERGAQLVRDGGDELVLHAVERATLGGVAEGDDDADGLAAFRAGVDLRTRDIFHGEAGAILAPEDFVRDPHGVEVADRGGDGAVLFGIRGAIGVGMVDHLVQVAADELVGFVAEHL